MKIAFFAFFITLVFAIAVPEAPPAFRSGQIARQNAARQTQNNDAKQAAAQEGQGKNGNTKNTNPVMNWWNNQQWVKSAKNTYESTKRKLHQNWTNTFNRNGKNARNGANLRSTGATRSQNAQRSWSQPTANKASIVPASLNGNPAASSKAKATQPAKKRSSHAEIVKRVDKWGKSTGVAYEGGTPTPVTLVNVGKYTLEEKTAIAYEKMREAAKIDEVKVTVIGGFQDAKSYGKAFKKNEDMKYQTKDWKPMPTPGSAPRQSGKNVWLKAEGSNRAWLDDHAREFGFCRIPMGFDWHYKYSPGKC